MLFMALLSHVPQDDLPSNSTLEFNNIDYFFHLIEYTVLGFLLYRSFDEDESFSISPIIGSIIIGIIFAITDELHQAFVPGRNMSFADLCFNFIGVNIGLFVSFQKKLNSP
jgi:VanZ family protein